MRDRDAVEFLQWALPRLGLRWRGFRKVRRQVRRRLARRLAELGLADLRAYRAHLAANEGEWRRLDGFCRIPISRFHRDRAVFGALAGIVLPALAAQARVRGAEVLRCWSAGCASGEEPYTLAILWQLELAGRFADLAFEVTASDVDAHLLERARAATYRASSLREVPPPWRAAAFDEEDGLLRLREPFRGGVHLEQRDIREGPPEGPFDLVLCRNLALTYFDDATQRQVLSAIRDVLVPGGALVVGVHERLPADVHGFAPWDRVRCVFRCVRGAPRP